MTRGLVAMIAGLALTTLVVGDTAPAWARAGGGGSRGSRSYSAPRSMPTQPRTPSSPSRSYTQPAPAPAPGAPGRPSPFRGFLGGLAGFALGGLLGSMLFGGFGRGFGGIGLLDLVLVGVAIALLVGFLKRRREAATEPAYAAPVGGPSGWAPAAVERDDPAATPERVPVGAESAQAEADRLDLARGVAHIRQMDPGFDPDALAETARVVFSEVQQALGQRDITALRDRLAPEMQALLQAQTDRLRSAGRTNRVERIVVRRTETTEAWQESGRDWATVGVQASMLDYVVDDATGAVVEGSRTAPVDLEEYWTFTRPVGDNPWRLSAIQTP